MLFPYVFLKCKWKTSICRWEFFDRSWVFNFSKRKFAKGTIRCTYMAQTISGLFCENALKGHRHGFWMRYKSQSGSVVAPEGWKPLQASMTKMSLFVLVLHHIYGLSPSGILLIFLAVMKMEKATLSFYFPVMNFIHFANFHCILLRYSGSIHQGKLCRDYFYRVSP